MQNLFVSRTSENENFHFAVLVDKTICTKLNYTKNWLIDSPYPKKMIKKIKNTNSQTLSYIGL